MLVSFFKNHAFVCPIREQNITTKDNFSDERWGSAFWSSNCFSYLPFLRYKGSKHHFKWYVNFSFFVQFWWDLFHWIPLNKSFQHCAAICFSIRYRFFRYRGPKGPKTPFSSTSIRNFDRIFDLWIYVYFVLLITRWAITVSIKPLVTCHLTLTYISWLSDFQHIFSISIPRPMIFYVYGQILLSNRGV